MSKTPVVYKSTHRIKFSDLDPYQHMRTAVYSAYYVDHRMNGLREHAGWDLEDPGEVTVHGLGQENGGRLSTACRRRSGDHHHIVRARVPWA